MNNLFRLGFKPSFGARRHAYTLHPRIHPHILSSRPLAAEYVNRIMKQDSELRVFTDGARSRFPGGGAGAAARARTPFGTIIIKEYLGPAADHTSLEAEILGAALGVRTIRTITSLRVTQATIFVDCQQAIHEILSGRPKPQHEALVQRFHDEVRSMPHLEQIRLAWVPAHNGVEMNELVDRDAKDAAASGESGTILISSGFQLYLPQPSKPDPRRNGLRKGRV